MPGFLPTVALATLVTTTINLLRYLRGRDWNGATTIAAAWVAGVTAVMVAAQTDFASGIAVGDRSLEGLNVWSQLFVGLSAASIGSFLIDAKKAVDNTDTAVKPPLIPVMPPQAENVEFATVEVIPVEVIPVEPVPFPVKAAPRSRRAPTADPHG